MLEAIFDRGPALAAIEEALESARAGVGALVVVEAPLGMGKTHLLRAARSLAAPAGIDAAIATGGATERNAAHAVARQLLHPLVKRLSGSERADVFSGAAAASEPIVGDTATRPAAATPAESSYSLHWLVAALAERRPLLLCVDDAHWGDPPSLRALEYTARRLDFLPVALLVAARPTTAEPQATLLARLESAPGARRLELEPLSAHGVARMLGEPEGSTAVAACLHATRGTPLLVEAVARSGGTGGDVAPEAVAGDALRRIRALGPGPLAALRALAVLGGEQPPARVAALAGLADDATAALDTLVVDGVATPGRSIGLVHPVIADGAYADMPPRERARAHRRAAELLHAADASADEIAAHLVRTDATGDAWVADRLRDAATAALATGATDMAVRYLRRALAEDPAAADPVLLCSLGEAELHAGDPAGEIHLRAAIERTAPDGRTRSTLSLAAALLVHGRMAEAVDLLFDAIDDTPAGEPRLLLEAEAIAAAASDFAFRERVQRRLVDRWARPPEGASRGERAVLAGLAFDSAWTGAPADRTRMLAERALGDGRLLEDEGAASPMLGLAIAALLLVEDVAAALSWLERGRSAALAAGSVTGQAIMTGGRAMAHAVGGDLGAVEAELGLHERIRGSAVAPVSDPLRAGLEAMLALERGAAGEATDRVARLDGASAVSPSMLWVRFVEARALAADGDLPGAQRRLAELGETMRSLGLHLPSLLPWRTELAALLPRDRADEARELADEELARGTGRSRVAEARALRTLGLLERGAAGLDRLAEAAEVAARSPNRLEHARTLIALGAARRRAGERRGALGPLREGLDLADRCGATVQAAHARDELVAVGARPRRARLRGVAALTASELRIARLAGGGATNREIAQTLFLAPKTVERHLTSVYAKLGVTSRQELLPALSSGDPPG